jgi:aspartyl aminopeptidase
MLQDKETFNDGLAKFLDASPTPFHAVSEMSNLLRDAGFSELSESDDWSLVVGGKHFVTRNESSLIAFIVGAEPLTTSGIKMVGAHTDSPCLMVKPQPEINKQGFIQLGVEVYGGALLHPWFDRDLSMAGRVVYHENGKLLKQTLVDFKRPVALIPSLAIHLDRDANKDHSVNPQNDIVPILMHSHENHGASGKKFDFRRLLRDEFLSEKDEVLDYEVCLYDAQPTAIIGLNNEFIASARLDNLLSCYVATQSIINADTSQTCLMVCNDHEEVGSISACGADGPFLETITLRLCDIGSSKSSMSRVVSNSLMISCDNAHATHPNFALKHDPGHMPKLNGGPVIKVNVKQRYSTNSLTSSMFKRICSDVGVPFQSFVSRNDMGCGSTIGPITSARLGVQSLDVGIPQLAMHSCREIAGVDDPLRLSKALTMFFEESVSDINKVTEV